MPNTATPPDRRQHLRTGPQALAKVAATSDGGCWMGWFDNRSGGCAARMQRSHPAGNEQVACGGILVMR